MNIIDFKQATLDNGGYSWNILSGNTNPITGYQVSQMGREVKIEVGKFGCSDIVNFIKGNTDLISGLYLGSWIHEGHVYLDVTDNWSTFDIAVKNGIRNKQIAIWDCEYKRNIYMPNQVVKTLIGGNVMEAVIEDVRKVEGKIEYITSIGIVPIEDVIE
jgi:hypothetical protein